MIRPVTCVCFLLACGSGLYLYQSKHRVQVLDREIEKTVHDTDALRERTRMLHAEWTLMNDPQRLQALSEQFLNLKTVTPGQFTSMADLDNRLPAVRVPDAAPAVAPAEPAAVPIAEAPESAQPEELPRPPAVAPAPPPKPASVATVAPPPPRTPEPKPAPPRPQVAEVQPVRPPAPIVRPPPARIMPVALPARLMPATSTGSALGMAHSATVPPPQPVPVNASQWVTNGGGGG
jgi:hypothetical protein